MNITEATTLYTAHLRARGLSENTITNATQILGRGTALWGDIPVRDISPAHIDDLFGHYAWAPTTRNLYLTQLNAFLDWAKGRRLTAPGASPTQGWRSVRVPRRERLRVPLSDFPALLDAAAHPRDRAVCALGLFTFLRGSELRTLRVSDLDLDHNLLTVYRHKTKTADVLPVSSELHTEMVRWLNWYRHNQGALRPGWYLVPAKNSCATTFDPTTRQVGVDHSLEGDVRPNDPLNQPYAVVQRALSTLGYDTKGEGEHTLRRSGARALADSLRDQGYDGALRRVASMLGHSDSRVTEKYIGWEMEREQRNADIAGKPMFPTLHTPATVTQIGA